MSSNAKRYFMCTPFDTAADGLYHLGTIIETPSSRTRVNTDKSRLPVPASDLAPLTTLTGWTASATDLKSGKFGFWTKVLYGLGIKPTVKYEAEFSANDMVTCREITVTKFDPTYNYIKDSVISSEVQEALKRLHYKPVYMITALMVGKDVKLEKSTAQSQVGGGSVDVTGVTDMIGGGGVEISGKTSQATKMGYSATNVIVAYTLKKIQYTKRGDIKIRDWDRGNVGFPSKPEHLQKASDSTENEEEWVLGWNELEPSDFEIGLEITSEVLQGESVDWVGPKLTSDLK